MTEEGMRQIIMDHDQRWIDRERQQELAQVPLWRIILILTGGGIGCFAAGGLTAALFWH